MRTLFNYRDALRVVRPFTGEWFTPAHGYDARKPPSFGQRMAVLKYYRKIQELTAVETQVYTPKRGEKAEAFSYTGQTGFRKFTKALVRKVSKDQEYHFELDRSRPKGHRFIAVDQRGRRHYRIPEQYFDGEDIDADTYRELLEEYASDAEFFLINAGEAYMWGAGGGKRQIANKLAEIFRNYSATQFDAHDKNSSYYGNWFRGVTGFTSRSEILPEVRQALQARADYRRRHNIQTAQKSRQLLDYGPNGRRMIGHFENGRMVSVSEWAPPLTQTPYTAGAQAFLSGMDIKTNPYIRGSPDYRLWRAGWLGAARAHR